MSFRRKDRDLLSHALNELSTNRILLERIEAGVITKYTDSPTAAAEFTALKKAVFAGARAEGMHQKHLLGLVESIDEGANVETVRHKILDLLRISGIVEIPPTDISTLPVPEAAPDLFREVGDAASESPAWIRVDESGQWIQVVQMGRVRELPTLVAVAEPPSPTANITTETPDQVIEEAPVQESGPPEPSEDTENKSASERSAQTSDGEESK